MAKAFITYITITVSLIVLFNILGLQTASGSVLQQWGVYDGGYNITNPESSGFISLLVTWLGLLGIGAGIIVGIFGRGDAQLGASAIIATSLGVVFIGDLISIISHVVTLGESYVWISNIGVFIGAMLIVGFGFAVWDWVRRHD